MPIIKTKELIIHIYVILLINIARNDSTDVTDNMLCKKFILNDVIMQVFVFQQKKK